MEVLNKYTEEYPIKEYPVEYDRWGRMKYNPVFHGKHGKPWTTEDISYLINWWEVTGTIEMSYALERTPGAIEVKIDHLIKVGIMKPRRDIVA